MYQVQLGLSCVTGLSAAVAMTVKWKSPRNLAFALAPFGLGLFGCEWLWQTRRKLISIAGRMESITFKAEAELSDDLGSFECLQEEFSQEEARLKSTIDHWYLMWLAWFPPKKVLEAQ